MSAQPHILTAQGRDRLRAELHQLITVRRLEVAQHLREAKDLGELVENAEYEDAKTEQAFVESRIAEIKNMLGSARVIEVAQVSTSEVGVGSIVDLKDQSDGSTWALTIVGWVEVDPMAGLVSNESPLGEALMGRQPGDNVVVQTPDGPRHYTILSLRRPRESADSNGASDAAAAKPARKPAARKPAARKPSSTAKQPAAAKATAAAKTAAAAKKKPASPAKSAPAKKPAAKAKAAAKKSSK